MEAVIFYTYILYSESKDKFYVGYTSDIDKRLDKHNSGSSRSTKDGIPWKLVYFEEFEHFKVFGEITLMFRVMK